MKPYHFLITGEKDPPRAGGVSQVLYGLIQGPTHSYAFVQEFSKESILHPLFRRWLVVENGITVMIGYAEAKFDLNMLWI